MHDETKAIHVPARRPGGAISPPVQLSTTYEHGPAGERLHDFTYVRGGNPNVSDLQTRLAAIEDADGAVAFSSGMAAAAAVLSRLAPGSRVVFHQSLYFDVLALTEDVLPNWGIKCIAADLADPEARTRVFGTGVDLVWFETPSNPLMDILDIEAIAQEARQHGAEVLVDGTFATPVVQKPLNLGATYVLHSMTKYMGGHSDVQGGAIAFRGDDSTYANLAKAQRLGGGVLAPFNAWLISRGLQTLYCRMERHSANAHAIAVALEGHPAIERVRYPFLPNHPGFDIAKRQMKSGGGMLSIQLKGGREAAVRLAKNVRLFVNATSLGGVESLIEHRASVEGAGSTTPDDLLRISVGLENADDLIEDVMTALGSPPRDEDQP